MTGYVIIYNNPSLHSLGAAPRGVVLITVYCSVYNNGNDELTTAVGVRQPGLSTPKQS